MILFFCILFFYPVDSNSFFFKEEDSRKSYTTTDKAKSGKFTTPAKNNIKTKRSIANKKAFSDWRKVSFFSTPNNTIYEYKNNDKILLILQKEEAVPSEERKNITDFFKKTEEEKAIILSSSTIKNRKTSYYRIKNKGETSLFYLEGSYLSPVETQKTYYQEWHFYTNEDSIYILVSLDEPIEKEERKSVQTFIEEWLESFSSFSMEEKTAVLSFVRNK